MPDYIVRWEIDAEDTSSPVRAAQDAFEAITRPGSVANVFAVTDTATGESWRIDLHEKTTTSIPNLPTDPLH